MAAAYQQEEEALTKQLEEDGITTGACSFTPQTVVATQHGEHPIGTLHVGDKVWAYNPKTHKMELQPILHVWIHQDNDLVDLTIITHTTVRHGSRTTTSTTPEVIHTNQKHPFYTIERGFLAVSHITIGMHILRADGRVGVVTGRKVVSGTRVMYNLEVAQDHTFTVGEGQWVVHNDCGAKFPNDPSKVGHIFRNAFGHLPDDTPANRQLFTDTTANSDNYIGTDRYGKEWYAQTLSDGRQVWVWVRNGMITDAGVNDTPRYNWDPNQGLVP